MKLSSFTDYSLRVLMYVGSQKENNLCTTKKISEYFDISYNHLVKVVHRLSSKGYLEIKKGRQGGIRLAQNPERIFLGSFIQEIEPDLNLVECFSEIENNCKIVGFCKVKHHLAQARNVFIIEMNKISISDVLEGTEEQWSFKLDKVVK